MFGQRFRRFLLLAALMALAACSKEAGAPVRTPDTHVLSGEVLERSPGTSSRPDWADDSQPISRQGETLRVSGYVAVSAKKRREAAELAADSYAKAELVRFLATRVKAILSDKMSSREASSTVEKITERAGGWVAALPVSARYWEKRKDDSGEQFHVWSRVDLEQAQLDGLLAAVLEQTADLASPIGTLRQEVRQNWDKLADPTTWERSLELPEGTFVPAWAKAGDHETAQDFRFVCHGFGADERVARAQAEASCSEKLCKLFGVEIRSETKVVENLEGLTAESQVTERCPEVRAIGRQTQMHTGECGPDGCVFWTLQSYPQSAYEAEKKRLEQPTIIRQQVVIQEGDQVFRDPQKCEDALGAYGAVEGLDYQALAARTAHLNTALIACQGIDGRDIGLFQSLDLALTRPLDRLKETKDSPETVAFEFLVMKPDFSDRLTRERFLTGRIQIVRDLVAGALLPMKLAELRSPTEAQLDAVIAELLLVPISDDPTSPHHNYNLLDFTIQTLLAKPDFPYSTRLRDFLLRALEAGELFCSSYGGRSAPQAISYLRRDPHYDERSWTRILGTLIAAKGDSIRACVRAAFAAKGAPPTTAQADQVSELIVGDQWPLASQVGIFEALLGGLPVTGQIRIYQRFEGRIDGGDEARAKLRQFIQYHAFEYERRDREHCRTRAQRIRELARAFPDFDIDRTLPCACLAPRVGLSEQERQQLIAEIGARSRKRACDEIRESEWPGGYYVAPKPERLPTDGPTPLDRVSWELDAPVKECLGRQLDVAPLGRVARIRARASARSLDIVGVDVAFKYDTRSLRFRDERPGYVTLADVSRVLEQTKTCIEPHLRGATLPAGAPVVRESSPRAITIEYESDVRRSAYGSYGLD